MFSGPHVLFSFPSVRQCDMQGTDLDQRSSLIFITASFAELSTSHISHLSTSQYISHLTSHYISMLNRDYLKRKTALNKHFEEFSEAAQAKCL